MDPLPIVPDVTRLSKNVIRILGQNGPSKFVLQGTNTYLIGTGRARILLDTGEGAEGYIPLLQKVLAEEKCSIHKILLSHWHHDHIDGLPSVRELLKSHQLETAKPELEVWKYRYEDDEPDWLSLKDQDEVQVEGATLRAIHTPGHTIDHLAFHLVEDNIVFTADHILGGSTSVFQDLHAYMSSLRKLQRLNATILFPGHGLEITNAAETIQSYLSHRQAREDQIVQVLQQNRTSTAMGLVKVIYKDVREDLHLAAEYGVKQHLEKLEKEGRVKPHGDDEYKLIIDSKI